MGVVGYPCDCGYLLRTQPLGRRLAECDCEKMSRRLMVVSFARCWTTTLLANQFAPSATAQADRSKLSHDGVLSQELNEQLMDVTEGSLLCLDISRNVHVKLCLAPPFVPI